MRLFGDYELGLVGFVPTWCGNIRFFIRKKEQIAMLHLNISMRTKLNGSIGWCLNAKVWSQNHIDSSGLFISIPTFHPNTLKLRIIKAVKFKCSSSKSDQIVFV
jgi:hypothetical protein